MPRYIPINAGVYLKASHSDLVNIGWRQLGLDADFIIPGDTEHFLRVSFERQSIVRLVDEMPLSTEQEDSPDLGLISDHFAYRVEGAAFERAQSQIWRDAVGPAVHFRFITGWTCMDVLSPGAPSFKVLPDLADGIGG